MLSLPKHLYRTAKLIWTAWLGYFSRLSLFTLLSALHQVIYAQHPAPRVYTYVEHMPQLPGGGGMGAVTMALLKHVRWPVADLSQQCTGRALIYLEVNPSGAVQHVKLLRATGSAALDSALTTAAKLLPHFTPGHQNNLPVTVSMTLLINCIKPQ